jgi:RNA polymerase sigma-70 factor (ECF subfamily)
MGIAANSCSWWAWQTAWRPQINWDTGLAVREPHGNAHRIVSALGVHDAMGYARRMDETNDETLMLRYGSGDMSAFEILYDRYRGPLYRYFLRQIGEPATTNDLYQGCWEKVIGARQRYDAKAPFKAWLFRIARNHLVDHHRAARPNQSIEQDVVDDAGTGPEAQAEATERDSSFRTALAQLPEYQREALLLRLEGGLSLEEIGSVTGAGFETAKSRLRYATNKLKQALQT